MAPSTPDQSFGRIREYSPTADEVAPQRNSIIGWGATTPQDYPETTGFGRQTEREWVTRRSDAGLLKRTYSCASTSLAMTGSGCAASRRPPSTRTRLRCLAGGIARRPAQSQASAGAVERAPQCREASEGRGPQHVDQSAVVSDRGPA